MTISRVLAPALAAFLAPASNLFPASDLSSLLAGVENHYNRAQTLQVSFEQSYTAPSRGRRVEAGELFLRKPGRMRWNYSSPPGKVFVSDGKNLYFYSPNTNRVEKMGLKESDDMRAPLAFLLGRLDFKREFREFRVRPAAGGQWIAALPKSDRLPYRLVEFLVKPSFEIQQLKVTAQDNSVMEFQFERERVNPPIGDSMFRFQPPPGTELVETVDRPDRNQ